MSELQEKAIKGLELCLRGDANLCEISCPYFDQCGAYYDNNEALLKDLLFLLKTQEPVKPERESSSSGLTWWNICGNCKTAINPNDKFCHECGRSVKWE